MAREGVTFHSFHSLRPVALHSLPLLIARYGYAVVVVFLALEGIGIPLPGETTMIVAAALAARGQLSILGVIGAGTLGAVLAGAAGYGVGHIGKRALEHGGSRWVARQSLERAERFWQRYGAPSVLFARFVPVLRTLVPMFAGGGRMPFGRFFLYNALGALIWAAAFGGLGQIVGRELQHTSPGTVRAVIVVAGLLALAVGLSVAVRGISARRNTRGGTSGSTPS